MFVFFGYYDEIKVYQLIPNLDSIVLNKLQYDIKETVGFFSKQFNVSNYSYQIVER